MKRPLATVVAILGLLVLAGGPALAEVNWSQSSFEEILQTAKKENKYVFIDFYTLWCGPCKRMDDSTYAIPEVIEYLNAMIPVKYDSENGAGIEISKKYRIRNWPTTVLIGPDGDEIDRVVGYLAAEPFLKVFNDYQKGINTVAFYERLVEANPNDADAWKALAMKHAEANRLEEGDKALARYLELKPDLGGEERAELLYTLGDLQYKGGSYDAAAGTCIKIIDEFADTEWLDPATVTLARCYHKLGKDDECITTYLSYVNRHPDSPGAMNSFAWFCSQAKIGFDQALPIALKAVEISDRSPGILDTLAELYYAMGQYDKAIKIGKEALASDPDDQYFNNQVKKFEEAKEAADSQARN